MIDEDDATVAMVLAPLGGVVGFLVVLGILIAWLANERECSDMHCKTGVPRLIEHECICVEQAK